MDRSHQPPFTGVVRRWVNSITRLVAVLSKRRNILKERSLGVKALARRPNSAAWPILAR